ncbi:metallophosphoesterase family protein [Acidobacteriota bacterium]
MNSCPSQFLRLFIRPIALTFLLILTLCCSTGSIAEDEFSFVFFTDVHLQKEKNAVQGFTQAIEKINQLNPDFVISGGDNITDALGQNFERADMLFELYRKTIGYFRMPIYHVLGNHDVFGVYPSSGVENTHPEFGKKMFRNRLGKRYYSFDHKGWHFIVLDSVSITEDGKYLGGIDGEQIEWLKDHLSTVDRETPIVISVHVPFYSIIPLIDKRFKTDVFTIDSPARILDMFKDFNLKLVLQGHVHYHEVILAEGVHFVSGGAICSGWWDGKHRGIEEGFLSIEVKGDSVTWDYIDYGWIPENEK